MQLLVAKVLAVPVAADVPVDEAALFRSFRIHVLLSLMLSLMLPMACVPLATRCKLCACSVCVCVFVVGGLGTRRLQSKVGLKESKFASYNPI